MEYVHKLENIVAGWYKNMPHLPGNGQKWLAQNAWWLVLVWVVLGAMGVVGLLLATFFAGAFMAGFGTVGAALGGLSFLLVTLTLLFSIALVVVGAMAISPLKLLQKKGWTLLFIMLLVTVASDVITFLFTMNLFGLIWNVLFAGVGAYFLFEVHSYFVGGSSRKKVTAKQKKAE